ncbi:MAG: AAA domain-containing protein [Bacteroidota bacterium]
MDKATLGQLFYREIEKIVEAEQSSDQKRVEQLYRLMGLIFVEATKRERIQFSTLFSRMVYACQNHQIDRKLQLQLHHFRKAARARKLEDVNLVYRSGLFVLSRLIEPLFEAELPATFQEILPKSFALPIQDPTIEAFHETVRVVVMTEDRAKEQLIARVEVKEGQEVRIQYNIADRNTNFNKSIDQMRNVFGFPLTVNLLDVEVDSEGVYRPRAFVIEPDYLVDISAIAACVTPTGAEPVFYLLKKFLPMPTNVNLTLGNIANFFLDEIMTHPETTFKETFGKVFQQLNPLTFCLYDDREIKSMMQKSQLHYSVLKRMVLQDFEAQNIDPKSCLLEPSFYSETYGIQGRLDVFYNEDGESAIVELKSGKVYRPNQYGITPSHFTQTLLYDLMIRSVFGKKIDPKNYILYSGVQKESLRFAPRIKAQQYEALQIRNQLVAIDWELSHLSTFFNKQQRRTLSLERGNPFLRINSQRFPHVKGFLGEDIRNFERNFQQLTPVEQKYFTAFSGFIAREHQLAKVGIQGIDQAHGLAALWLKDRHIKQEQFELLSHLEIIKNESKEEQPLLYFKRTERTHPLANFRKGDIAILYPAAERTRKIEVLSHQIFKGNIIDINDTEIIFQLRSRQFNSQLFEAFEQWHIEHDMMDSSFIGMYRGLYQFAQHSKSKRQLLLTARPPKKSQPLTLPKAQGLTDEQHHILEKALAAEEYFLLWGPPGTGKTSVMLKSMVQHLLENTEENILLLAYTNRAVDEICESIERIDDSIKEHYLRIGSLSSTSPRFRPQLLNHKIQTAKSRKEIKDVLLSHRIFVSTVSSMVSRPELMKLKTFHRAIIDEASQVLEPLLIGLLPHFKRFMLIGDHRQLPAVVQQTSEESQVDDEALTKYGLHNLRNSLFERLYHRARKMGWKSAYAQLSHQGRMHADIMAFPNLHFYQKTLQILPNGIEHSLIQQQHIHFELNGESDYLQDCLCANRTLFIPTASDAQNGMQKTNRQEALMIKELVEAFHRLYERSNKTFTARSIGVITPYRAQIAQIKEVLKDATVDANLITIDTVERYQGGARDIILISLCTNNLSQLNALVSLSDDGVDRKLNVALTRAREHLIVLGNEELLRHDRTYAALMGSFLRVEGEVGEFVGEV